MYFTAGESATCYAAASVSGYGSGTYKLSVTELDDFAATTGEVSVGGSATGEIHSLRDADWFAVTLEAGTTYRIDLEGSRTDAGTLRDPYLRGVHDANGARLAGTTNDDGGTRLQQPVDVRGGGERHLLRGGRRLWKPGGHLHAVGGRGHGQHVAAPVACNLPRTGSGGSGTA